jgi:hypothetical protein
MLSGETVAFYCENHTDHTDTVRTAQETHYVSATEQNRLILFGETVLLLLLIPTREPCFWLRRAVPREKEQCDVS